MTVSKMYLLSFTCVNADKILIIPANMLFDVHFYTTVLQAVDDSIICMKNNMRNVINWLLVCKSCLNFRPCSCWSETSSGCLWHAFGFLHVCERHIEGGNRRGQHDPHLLVSSYALNPEFSNPSVTSILTQAVPHMFLYLPITPVQYSYTHTQVYKPVHAFDRCCHCRFITLLFSSY